MHKGLNQRLLNTVSSITHECTVHVFPLLRQIINEMGAPYNQMEMASFMTCSKGYMGECGIRGGRPRRKGHRPKMGRI